MQRVKWARLRHAAKTRRDGPEEAARKKPRRAAAGPEEGGGAAAAAPPDRSETVAELEARACSAEAGWAAAEARVASLRARLRALQAHASPATQKPVGHDVCAAVEDAVALFDSAAPASPALRLSAGQAAFSGSQAVGLCLRLRKQWARRAPGSSRPPARLAVVSAGRANHRAAIEAFVADERDDAWSHRVEGCEVGTVPAADPRAALRGQKALYARRQIASGVVLGEFGGTVQFEAEYLAGQTLRAVAENHESYQFLFWAKAVNGLVDQDGHDLGPLIVDACASPARNDLMYANDYRADPFGDRQGDAAQAQGGPNAAFVEVLDRGWPRVFVVTVAALAPGDEVLVDYGEPYWHNQRLQRQRQAAYRTLYATLRGLQRQLAGVPRGR